MKQTSNHELDAKQTVMDIVYGRWRSQTLYTGVELGVFSAVGTEPKRAAEITDELDVDPELGYRLLRALGSLGLLDETADQRFTLTAAGEILCAEHPESLRGIIRVRQDPIDATLWSHLSDVIRDGDQNAFIREYDQTPFEWMNDHPGYADRFTDAMDSYSKQQTPWVLEMLDEYDLSDISHLCDIGGGSGYMLCRLLDAYPHLDGTILERPSVIAENDETVASTIGVAERCSYVAGDMFEEVPHADAYTLKYILHDWDDEECIQILSTIHAAAPQDARVLLIEHIVPGPETPHHSKLFDIHMMVWGSGRERTTDEYAALLAAAGWEYVETWYPDHELMGAVEAVKT